MGALRRARLCCPAALNPAGLFGRGCVRWRGKIVYQECFAGETGTLISAWVAARVETVTLSSRYSRHTTARELHIFPLKTAADILKEIAIFPHIWIALTTVSCKNVIVFCSGFRKRPVVVECCGPPYYVTVGIGAKYVG